MTQKMFLAGPFQALALVDTDTHVMGDDTDTRVMGDAEIDPIQ